MATTWVEIHGNGSKFCTHRTLEHHELFPKGIGRTVSCSLMLPTGLCFKEKHFDRTNELLNGIGPWKMLMYQEDTEMNVNPRFSSRNTLNLASRMLNFTSAQGSKNISSNELTLGPKVNGVYRSRVITLKRF